MIPRKIYNIKPQTRDRVIQSWKLSNTKYKKMTQKDKILINNEIKDILEHLQRKAVNLDRLFDLYKNDLILIENKIIRGYRERPYIMKETFLKDYPFYLRYIQLTKVKY